MACLIRRLLCSVVHEMLGPSRWPSPFPNVRARSCCDAFVWHTSSRASETSIEVTTEEGGQVYTCCKAKREAMFMN